MKILLLVDNGGTELQLFKNGTQQLVLQITDNVSENKIIFEMDDEDRECLIGELARLRTINQ